MSEIPDEALEDLEEALWGCRRDWNGGYPPFITVNTIQGYIIIADLVGSDWNEPTLIIIKICDFLKLWRKAKRRVATGEFEDMTEAINELGIHEIDLCV